MVTVDHELNALYSNLETDHEKLTLVAGVRQSPSPEYVPRSGSLQCFMWKAEHAGTCAKHGKRFNTKSTGTTKTSAYAHTYYAEILRFCAVYTHTYAELRPILRLDTQRSITASFIVKTSGRNFFMEKTKTNLLLVLWFRPKEPAKTSKRHLSRHFQKKNVFK